MDNTAPVHETEFVWRRLTDALVWGGKEYNGHWWLMILVPIVLIGLVYVGWMYVRDSRSVGWKWAALLGVLRSSVYIILALMFLLPAKQHWDTTKINSKVLVLFDVSGSMENKDDLPSEEVPVEKLLTRQDKILQFLSDEQIAFLQKLREKTPVTIYRFGGRLDDEIKVLDPMPKVDAKEWTAFLKPQPPSAKGKADATGLSKAEQYEALTGSTNIDESLRSLLNREGTNMLQGIIVISDGRNTNFNSQVFAEVQTRAAKMQVPIFTVAVGEHREPVNLRITELLVPERQPPDEKFPIRVEIDGEGLAEQTVQAELEVYGPESDKPVLVIPAPATFKLGAGTPHAQAEFIIDPEKLPPELRNPKAEAGKPELLQGKWKFVARVPVDKREIERKDNVSAPEFVTVVKKPLRVLLFAGGPTRDYQFARTLFVREEEQQRGEVSIYLQGARKDIQQDVKPERLLDEFPTFIKNVNDPVPPEQKYYNLMQYDVIICFDPDWTQLREGQVKLLEEWVQRHAGGLILVAGPVHTFELARPGAEETKLRPILDLYPVKLNDNRIHSIDRNTKEPWRLHFPGVTRDTEYLKLDDTGDDPLSGWESFFTGAAKEEPGRELPLRRGFYDFYPVKELKPSTRALATFADPKAHTQDGKSQPYLAFMEYGSGRIIYVGSGELWRLRMFKEAFHERIWTKLARFVGAGSTGAAKSRGRIDMGKTFLTHSMARVESKLLGLDMKPLDPSLKPKAVAVPLFIERDAVTDFLKRHPGLPQDVINELNSISPDIAKLNELAEKQFPVLREVVPAKKDIEMVPKLAMSPEKWKSQTPEDREKSWEGWFSASFEIGTVPGKYEVQLTIPDSNEVIKRDYTVKPSNPERSNTRPDPAQLYRTAGLYREVIRPRLREETRNVVAQELNRTNQPFGASSEDDYRLVFDLPAAGKITDCLVTLPPRIHRSRGKVEDLWDSGFLVGTAEQPYKVSYALLVIIGLLSLEWLTRKLLRLA